MPLREGGSLPGLLEADDDGLYVVKMRGSGHGAKALVAELLTGELARAGGLSVPEIVLVELDAALGRAEPDPEIQDLLVGSAGTNLGLDFLPGAVTFDPVAGPAPSAELASRVVALDAFVLNVDRTPRNSNLLSWHRGTWLIDHGSSLFFHHAWEPRNRLLEVDYAFPEVREHVLLPWASALTEARAWLEALATDALLERLTGDIPGAWLEGDPSFATADEHRAAYLEWLCRRRRAIPGIFEEAERARSHHV